MSYHVNLNPEQPASCCPQVYLTTLEMVKAACRRFCERAQLTAAQTATVSNGVGGAVASLATQSVIVPIDVVRHGCRAGSSLIYERSAILPASAVILISLLSSPHSGPCPAPSTSVARCWHDPAITVMATLTPCLCLDVTFLAPRRTNLM